MLQKEKEIKCYKKVIKTHSEWYCTSISEELKCHDELQSIPLSGLQNRTLYNIRYLTFSVTQPERRTNHINNCHTEENTLLTIHTCKNIKTQTHTRVHVVSSS